MCKRTMPCCSGASGLESPVHRWCTAGVVRREQASQLETWSEPPSQTPADADGDGRWRLFGRRRQRVPSIAFDGIGPAVNRTDHEAGGWGRNQRLHSGRNGAYGRLASEARYGPVLAEGPSVDVVVWYACSNVNLYRRNMAAGLRTRLRLRSSERTAITVSTRAGRSTPLSQGHLAWPKLRALSVTPRLLDTSRGGTQQRYLRRPRVLKFQKFRSTS